jgi:hypothetical protein
MKLPIGTLATAMAAATLVACGGGGTNGTTPGGTVQWNTPAGGSTAAGAGSGNAGGAAAAGKPASTATAGTTSSTPPAGGANTGGAVATAPGAGGTPAAAAGSGAAGDSSSAAAGATAAAGASAAAGSGSSGTGMGGGSCGPEVTTSAADLGNPMMLGPYTPTHEENTGPSGSSWVYHPEELGKDGMKHPVFQWGPGAGTGPSNYLDHLNLLASHGFVIVSQASTQSGKGALDWILAENEKEGSMYYQKLDPERVGRGGHSMGALQSMSEADDDRLKLYVLVCGGAGGGGGADAIDNPTIFLGGTGLGDTRNFEGDYAETKGPTVFIRFGMTDHIYCARDNLGPWVAFMRWQFCGEEKWKKEFEPGGFYCTGEWDECETKNL